MKKYPFLLLTLLFFYSCQPKRDSFTISGDIKGLKVPYVHLKYMVNGVEKADSAAVKDGTFRFEGKTGDPEQALLYSAEAQFQKVFYLENLDMAIKGSADSLNKLVVSGSPVQQDFNLLEEAVQANRNKAIASDEMARLAGEKGDSVSMKRFQDEFTVLYNKEADIRKQFIVSHPKSHATLNELLNWANDANFPEAKKIYEGLDASLKQTRKAKEVAERLHNLEITQTGQPAIEFTQKDVNGKPVSLSAYKGKYVLLEFWASWCGPCRMENPNLRHEYQNYKAKGFNILAVSLDDNTEKWVKAIAKDSLPWTHVSDLKGWRNAVAVQYGVRGIPANFLISPEGKIVARDLRGEKLNAKLAEVFDSTL